jgi:hypothetical protein
MTKENDNRKQEITSSPSISEIMGLDTRDYTELIPGGREYFNAAVKSYSQQLFSEAKNIEQIEHAGDGPPEITAAHVEEAKWVLVRRQRRQVRSSRWLFVLRVGQVLSSAAIGIGASNFSQTWGSVLCVVGVFLVSMFLLIERELTREL